MERDKLRARLQDSEKQQKQTESWYHGEARFHGEEHEAYSQKGARPAREEEDGSSGLAPEYTPA